MIDIFEDYKEQPNLYIADVTVVAGYKPRANSRKIESSTIVMKKVPIVLLNGEFPTNNSRNKFLRRVFEKHIGRGSFENTNMRTTNISNVTFSSKLAYKFNYDVD